MSDNRPAAADDRSLVRVPCRWCVATGGRFRLWGDALSLAYRGARGLFVSGKVVRLCGWY